MRFKCLHNAVRVPQAVRVTQKSVTIVLALVSCLVLLGPSNCSGLFNAAATAQDRVVEKPHEWFASAPGEYVRLIEKGGVRLTVDDAKLDAAKKQALTIFRFKSSYQFHYRVQWIGTGGETPQSPPFKARISANLEDPKFDFEHTIVVRSGFRPSDPWRSSLIRHEFDHVSISTDPRLLRLMKKVWARRLNWVHTFQQETLPDEEDFENAIKEQIEAHTREFERVIQTHYDWLDQESKDGTANLNDRSAFFARMYTLESLKKCDFLYLDSARAIVQDGLNKDVTEHYLILEPP